MTYNLDEGINESFEFILGGHTYKMRYMTTEEMIELQKLENDPKAQTEFIKPYITGDEGAPDIADVMNKMTVPQLKRFNEMMKTEFDVGM